MSYDQIAMLIAKTDQAVNLLHQLVDETKRHNTVMEALLAGKNAAPAFVGEHRNGFVNPIPR